MADNGRKDIKIELSLNNLKADYNGKIYFFAKAHGESAEAAAMLQQSNEDENDDIILRSFNNGIGIASNVISEYTNIPYDSTKTYTDNLVEGIDNTGKTDKIITLNLQMPSNFNIGMSFSVAQYIHQILVDTAMCDWVRTVYPADIAIYNAVVEQDIVNLRNAVSRRYRPTANAVRGNDSVPYGKESGNTGANTGGWNNLP